MISEEKKDVVESVSCLPPPSHGPYETSSNRGWKQIIRTSTLCPLSICTLPPQCMISLFSQFHEFDASACFPQFPPENQSRRTGYKFIELVLHTHSSL